MYNFEIMEIMNFSHFEDISMILRLINYGIFFFFFFCIEKDLIEIRKFREIPFSCSMLVSFSSNLKTNFLPVR